MTKFVGFEHPYLQTCDILVIFLVPILKPLTANEFTVKDAFHFAKEMVDQQRHFFMGSLDVDHLFTNIPIRGGR